MSCQKTFIQSIGCVGEMRYWTLDETGTNNRVDSVAGDILACASSTFLTLGSQPGLYGNAVHLDNVNWNSAEIAGVNLFNQYHPITVKSPSVSMCGWFKIINPTPDYSQVTFEWDDSSSGVGNYLYFGITQGLSTASAFIAGDGNALSVNSPIVPTPTTGAWVFFHVFYDAANKKVGVSINNGAEVLFDAPADYSTYPKYYSLDIFGWYYGPEHASETLIDETMLYMGCKLNPQQLAYLYNSGAGRTWPITLP